MSQIVAEPNEELAIVLLAAGHDENMLRQHAGFPSVPAAREFTNRGDTKAEVERAVEARKRRVGIKGLATIEKMLDSESIDGRTRAVVARTALEVAGFLHKDRLVSETKLLRELSVAELSVMIEQTRAEIERLETKARPQPAALTAPS